MHEPQPSRKQAKQTLTILVLGLAMATFVYIGLTYLMPPSGDRAAQPALRLVLLAVGVVSALLAIVLERRYLDQAKSPGGVQMAVIIACALAEVSAILGLLYFLMTGLRDWALFGLSLLSYARNLLRLPEYHRMQDQL